MKNQLRLFISVFLRFRSGFLDALHLSGLTEMGNYAFDASHLTDLEMNIPLLTRYNSPTDFDPTVMRNIQDWISASASQMIFIHGEKDPWTVAAVDHPGNESILKIISPMTKLATRIASLSQSNRNQIIGKLNDWLRL